MTSSTHSRRSGFTLVELLISMGVFAIVMAAAIAAFRVGLTFDGRTSGRTLALTSASAAMDRISDDVLPASGVVAVYGSVVSGSESLVVSIPDFTANGDLATADDTVIYQASGSDLLVSTFPAPVSNRATVSDAVIMTGLPTPLPSSGLFTYLADVNGQLGAASPANATVVQVNLPATSTYGNRTSQTMVYSQLRLRNDR